MPPTLKDTGVGGMGDFWCAICGDIVSPLAIASACLRSTAAFDGRPLFLGMKFPPVRNCSRGVPESDVVPGIGDKGLRSERAGGMASPLSMDSACLRSISALDGRPRFFGAFGGEVLVSMLGVGCTIIVEALVGGSPVESMRNSGVDALSFLGMCLRMSGVDGR